MLPSEFGNFRAPVKFYVVENAIAHVILGMDFAKNHVRTINVVDNIVELTHPFAKCQRASPNFPVSNFEHRPTQNRPHGRSTSIQPTSVSQGPSKLSPKNPCFRIAKRNFYPFKPALPSLLSLNCSIPKSFRGTGPFRQNPFSRTTKRKSAPSFSYSYSYRGKPTFRRNFRACSNPFRRFDSPSHLSPLFSAEE